MSHRRKRARSRQTIDTAKLTILKITGLVLLTILCVSVVVFEAIAMWHFLRVYASTP
jgi:uncharacterized membrane protein